MYVFILNSFRPLSTSLPFLPFIIALLPVFYSPTCISHLYFFTFFVLYLPLIRYFVFFIPLPCLIFLVLLLSCYSVCVDFPLAVVYLFLPQASSRPYNNKNIRFETWTKSAIYIYISAIFPSFVGYRSHLNTF